VLINAVHSIGEDQEADPVAEEEEMIETEEDHLAPDQDPEVEAEEVEKTEIERVEDHDQDLTLPGEEDQRAEVLIEEEKAMVMEEIAERREALPLKRY
jgi:hypothetical protein